MFFLFGLFSLYAPFEVSERLASFAVAIPGVFARLAALTRLPVQGGYRQRVATRLRSPPFATA